MTTKEQTSRLIRTLDMVSALNNTKTALVERNGCKFSTTLELGTLETDEDGHAVLPSGVQYNPFAPVQKEALQPSSFIPPEHKTAKYPSKTYQLDQVEHLPTNGMLSDSDDDTDGESLKDDGLRFRHTPLTQSPFLASGKLSTHKGANYSEVGREYMVGMVEGLPTGEWAGEEIGFSPRLDDDDDDDYDDDGGGSFADFVDVEAQVKKEEEGKERQLRGLEEKKMMEMEKSRGKMDVAKVAAGEKKGKGKAPMVPKLNLKKGRARDSPRTRKIHSLTSRPQEKKSSVPNANPKGSLSARDDVRDISTAETDTMEDRMTNTTTNVSSNLYNDTVLSTINWAMTREEMDEIAANYNTMKHSPVKVKTEKKEKPFCNHQKYVEMQKKTKGKDWYIFNDGSPYVSKWEMMRRKDQGDPQKLMDAKGFRRFFGKQSEWEQHEFSIRSSSTYNGHEEEAGLVEGREDKSMQHKWLNKKGMGWNSIGTSTKPRWRRRNARGYKGYHGNVAEDTTTNEVGDFAKKTSE